jgi:hypothetical protein
MLILLVEVDSVLTPGVEVSNQFELLAAPWMKWMSNSETSTQIARIGRS